MAAASDVLGNQDTGDDAMVNSNAAGFISSHCELSDIWTASNGAFSIRRSRGCDDWQHGEDVKVSRFFL